MVNSKTAICRVLKFLIIKEGAMLNKEMPRQLGEVMGFDPDLEENKQVSF